MNINFTTQQLLKYVEKNEVAWQLCDSLIEFSFAYNHNIPDDEKAECDDRNKEMLDIIRNAKECRLINSKLDDHSCFEALIGWSLPDDFLILIDNQLLLCISICDKEKVLHIVA